MTQGAEEEKAFDVSSLKQSSKHCSAYCVVHLTGVSLCSLEWNDPLKREIEEEDMEKKASLREQVVEKGWRTPRPAVGMELRTMTTEEGDFSWIVPPRPYHPSTFHLPSPGPYFVPSSEIFG